MRAEMNMTSVGPKFPENIIKESRTTMAQISYTGETQKGEADDGLNLVYVYSKTFIN